jgi:serine protease Do
LQLPQRGVPDGFSELAARLSPSVVNISTAQTIELKDEVAKFPEGSPLERFNDFFGGRRSEGERVSKSLGSGFVIDADGHIVTNNHVIEGSDYIEVAFPNGDVFEAKLVGTDPSTDIAVLKFEAPDYIPHVSFGDSDDSDVGDWVMAIGNPFGYGGTVTAGIISARNRNINQGSYDDFIQTDVAINKGNSGGPLFNMAGDVIGVNTAIISPTGGSVGISFSVSADLASGVVNQLIEYGETRRSRLGVRVSPKKLTADLAESYGLDKPMGAIISGVVDDTPAKEAGLKRGDLIIAVDGEEIIEPKSIYRIIAGKEIGKDVEIDIVRKRKRKTLTATVDRLEEKHNLEKREAEEQAENTADRVINGISVEALSDEVREKHRIKSEVTGVRVTRVNKRSAAYGKLQSGDIIQEVDFETVETTKELEAMIAASSEADSASMVQVLRRGNYLFYGIRF